MKHLGQLQQACNIAFCNSLVFVVSIPQLFNKILQFLLMNLAIENFFDLIFILSLDHNGQGHKYITIVHLCVWL